MRVDDLPAHLEQITKVVAIAGYQTFTANSGQEAIDKAKELKPDLDSFATCRALCADDVTKDIPVIFVSS